MPVTANDDAYYLTFRRDSNKLLSGVMSMVRRVILHLSLFYAAKEGSTPFIIVQRLLEHLLNILSTRRKSPVPMLTWLNKMSISPSHPITSPHAGFQNQFISLNGYCVAPVRCRYNESLLYRLFVIIFSSINLNLVQLISLVLKY